MRMVELFRGFYVNCFMESIFYLKKKSDIEFVIWWEYYLLVRVKVLRVGLKFKI